MDVRDALVLSDLLTTARARRAISMPSSEHDQRRHPSPEELWARVVERAAVLEEPLARARRRAAAWLAAATRGAGEPVPFGHPAYPSRLAAVADPPPVLWVRGRRALLSTPAVALVGARAVTPYGREVAGWLGTELSRRGVTVISGLARGVDGAAHRGALQGSGGTVAVLGCGVDVVYPPEHAELAGALHRQGALVSELGPGAPPRRQHFPRRNRILSGLALGVVVVEAAHRSGSLITARLASDQGREVMAVPGNVLHDRNRGGHGLLRDGAALVESADDILREIGVVTEAGAGSTSASAVGSAPATDSLVRMMAPGEVYTVDTLCRLTGDEAPALLARVARLELEGRVERASGGIVVRPVR